jgi:ABC-type transport system involved in multi-copper enzyme maturation permease subunit
MSDARPTAVSDADKLRAARPVVLTSRVPETPSAWRAWWYLVRLSLQRQARTQQWLWIALCLLVLTTTVVGLNTAAHRWGMYHWRWPRRTGQNYAQHLNNLQALHALPWPSGAAAMQDALLTSTRVLLDRSGLFVFANWMVYSVFLSFLLPIWSLSFATDAVGGEREARTLLWLLTRPLPRPAIYLAKFLALLPWAIGLNLGGFGILCLAAGEPGRLAFRLFWPAVLCGSLAFGSLFHLMGACFRRATIVALVYAFFLETILGNLPGYMKRVSIGFYSRCMMFDEASVLGLEPPQKVSVYLPVDGMTAMMVLLGITVGCLALGMWLFARAEYQDLT